MPAIKITKPVQNGPLARQDTTPPMAGPIEGTVDLDKDATNPTVRGGLFRSDYNPTSTIPAMTQSGRIKPDGSGFDFAGLPIPGDLTNDCQVIVWLRWRQGTSPGAPQKVDFDSVSCRIA
jgi:hypothetical protein